MTNSTEGINLSQVCSEFLSSSSEGSNPGLQLASQQIYLKLKETGIFVGDLSEKEIDSFLNMWQTLITNPERFPQDASTPIGDFVFQEKSQLMESEMVKAVISAHLDLSDDQDELAAAAQKSVKIFHEDHPGSYILAYNRRRLGMFMLSTSRKDNGYYRVTYEFNPEITSFNGLY